MGCRLKLWQRCTSAFLGDSGSIVSTCVYIYIKTHVNIVCIYIYMHACMHACMYVNFYKHMHEFFCFALGEGPMRRCAPAAIRPGFRARHGAEGAHQLADLTNFGG